MKTYDLLKELSEAQGPSGFETKVRDLVEKLWRPLTDEITVDRVGTLVALKRGNGETPRRKILLAAHMDEIGLMVTKIDKYSDSDSGFLRVIGLGGVDSRQLLGQRVTVHGSRSGSEVPGIIGSLPPSMLPENSGKSILLSDMVVDVGKPSTEIEELISVGDAVSINQPMRKLLNKRAAGKSFDNRVSLVVLTKCLEMLATREHSWDVLAAATAQEETVLLGAYTTSYSLNPDAAIALDVTFAKAPGITEDSAYELGGGPANGLGPNMHPGMFDALSEAADRIEIKVHTDPLPAMSGTDAIGLQMAREGIPTGLVSVPIRYMHTSCEVVSLVDIKRTARWLAEFIACLDENFVDGLEEKLF